MRNPLNLLVAIFILNLGSSIVDGGEVETNRLKTEAPAAVRRMVSAYSRMSVAGRLVQYDKKRKETMTSDVKLTLCDELEKATQTVLRDSSTLTRQPKRERNYCVGRDAQFILDQNFKNGGARVLSEMQTITPKGQRPSRITSGIANCIKEYARSPLFCLVEVEDIIAGRGFKVVSSESIKVDGQAIYRYQVVRDPATDDQTSIVLELMPDHGWAIHHAEFEQLAFFGSRGNRFKYKSAVTIEYSADQGGVPVPSRVRCNNNFKEETIDFSRFIFGVTPPEREFTLGYFGLPDATRPIATARPGSFPYWMFGIGGLSLIAALLVWRRRTPQSSEFT